MITVKHHEHLIETIKCLSEIELDELLKDIGQHLYKNKLEHLIDSAFQREEDQTEAIEQLEEDVEKLELELQEEKENYQKLQSKTEEAVEILEDLLDEEFGEDFGKEQIAKAIKIFQ